MNWNALKSQCCPKCGYKLEAVVSYHSSFQNVSATHYECQDNPECEGFKIGANRMREIVESPAPTRRCATFTLGGEEHNLSELNNMRLK
jgi:hypothetical protein